MDDIVRPGGSRPRPTTGITPRPRIAIPVSHGPTVASSEPVRRAPASFSSPAPSPVAPAPSGSVVAEASRPLRPEPFVPHPAAPQPGAPQPPVASETPATPAFEQQPDLTPAPAPADNPSAPEQPVEQLELGDGPIPEVPESIPTTEPETPELTDDSPVGQVSQAPTTQPQRKSHMGSILVAIIIALALVAGAGYAYLQNNKTAPAAKATPAKTETKKVEPATADDVTKSSDAIDKAITGSDDNAGAAEADLSDTTLGL